jgi:hypothetical protein
MLELPQTPPLCGVFCSLQGFCAHTFRRIEGTARGYMLAQCRRLMLPHQMSLTR